MDGSSRNICILLTENFEQAQMRQVATIKFKLMQRAQVCARAKNDESYAMKQFCMVESHLSYARSVKFVS